MNLTALRNLEMTLRLSDLSVLIPPIQLKELTLNISKVASEYMSAENQIISLIKCRSLESL